jgi:RHH-type proline utilization regulon transcriptional repressor/proline dehydrogenase/delta 1-pyrroline-5-carboxylate dehydrogenase
MAELRVGDPAELATDVGPVIDARPSRASAHLQRLNSAPLQNACMAAQNARPGAHEWWRLPPSRSLDCQTCSRKSSARCCTSCAGAATRLAVIDQINALGYGLTLGIQTRIDSRAQADGRAARTWATSTSTAT